MKKKDLSLIKTIILISCIFCIVIFGVIVGGVVFSYKNWKVAKIPEPEEYFGASAYHVNGGYANNLEFSMDDDPYAAIKGYVAYVKENTDNIEIEVNKGADGDVTYLFSYDGFWIGDEPSFRIIYKGYRTEKEDYFFRFQADRHFKFVDRGSYQEDDSKEDMLDDTDFEHNDSPEKETEKETSQENHKGLVLPDPCLFFGCGRYEDKKGDTDNSWLVSCKFDLDVGKNVVSEYLELLETGDYPIVYVDGKEEDYVEYVGKYFFRFYFDYTGEDASVTSFDREGHEMTGMYLGLTYDYSAGTILLTIMYESSFELVDCGKQASVLPTSYSGEPSDFDVPTSDDTSPEFAKQNCMTCHGSGNCQECGGDGKVYRYNGDGDYLDTNCPTCRGSGDCRKCNGTGKR